MKRKIMLPIAALAFCGTIIITTSCQKEENKETTIKTSEKNQQSAEDQAVEKRILAFKESTQNPTKDETEIPVDEALWNIEAALNYTYCMGAGMIINPEEDELIIELSLNANLLLNFDEVAAAYNNAIDHFTALQAQMEPEGKAFNIVDVEDVTTPEQLADGKVVFNTTTVFGETVEDLGFMRIVNEIFGPDDNWYWGQNLGREDGYLAGYRDAGDLIGWQLTYYDENGNLLPHESDVYYTHVIKRTISRDDIILDYRNPNDDPIKDNLHDYLILYKMKATNLEHWSKILKYENPYNEMNFYLNSLRSIKEDEMDPFYSPKVFIRCVPAGLYEGNISNPSEIYHEVTFDYGIKHHGSIG